MSPAEEAGSVVWLSTRRFRERLKEDWPRIAPKFDLVVRKCIERGLSGPGDGYRQHGEHYAILFAGLTKAEAQLRCACIARDIADHFLGESNLADTVSVAPAGECADAGPPPAAGAEARGPAGRRVVAAAAAPRLEDGLADLWMTYAPMWNTNRNCIASYRCFPIRISQTGDVVSGLGLFGAAHERAGGATSTAIEPLLDVYVLNQVAELLQVRVQAGQVYSVVVPVHFNTIRTQPLRKEYVAFLKTVPADVLKRVVLEIVGVSDDGAHAGLFEPIMAVKPFCRAVLLDQPIGVRDFAGLRYIGLHSVGTNIDALGDPEGRIMAGLDRFAERAESAGLRTFVHGVRSRSVAAFAVGAGLNLVSGMPFCAGTGTIEYPSGIMRFTVEDLFADASRAARG